jgi:hypothetical protein
MEFSISVENQGVGNVDVSTQIEKLWEKNLIDELELKQKTGIDVAEQIKSFVRKLLKAFGDRTL